MATSEIHDELDELLADWSDEAGMTKDQLITMLNRAYGLDPAEMSDEHAERFVAAVEDEDVDEIKSVLSDHGLDDETIEQLEQQFAAQRAERDSDEGNEVSGDVSQPDGASGDGLTEAQRREVQQVVQQNVPSSQEIAQDIQNELSAGGGGEGGQSDQQSQMAMQLAQSFLQSQQGGGQAAKVGEMFEKKAMESAMQKMFAPDPFDIMRKKWAYEQAQKFSDSDEMPEWMDLQENMDMDLNIVEDDDEDDEDSRGWSFL